MSDINAQRLAWLHSGASNDVNGYEWGIYRVKWENGQAAEVWQTASNFSDLDAAAGFCAPKVEAPVARAEGGPDNIGTMIAKSEFALRWDEAAQRARSDDAVTPEFMTWLQNEAAREGVATNVAWNAGVAWARSATPKAELPASGLRAETDIDDGSLRLRLGRAISQAFGNVGSDGTVAVDPSDSDDIDGLVDSVMAVLRAETDVGGKSGWGAWLDGSASVATPCRARRPSPTALPSSE